jgi:hypothetical protein
MYQGHDQVDQLAIACLRRIQIRVLSDVLSELMMLVGRRHHMG